MIWDQMTCLWVSAPTRSVRGDLCALLWFYTGYVRLCYEKGAMSSCWKHAGFSWVFFFSFQARLLTFSGILSVVELLCIPGEITLTTLPALFDLTIRMIVLLLFLWRLLNYLHLYIWKTLSMK